MFELHNSDCLDILKNMSDEKIDMILTSPPYDDLRSYGQTDKIWNFEKFKKIAFELSRVIKPGGVIVWIVSDETVNGSETGTSFKQALYFKELGLNIHDTMIWNKDSSAFPDKIRYANVFEYMFVFSKGKPKTFNAIEDRKNTYFGQKIHGTYRGKDGVAIKRDWDNSVKEFGARFNVWRINSEKNNTTGHPAVFPLSLAIDHIKSWSNEGDLIFDPFMGSGTTGLACKFLNRDFIGTEIYTPYFDVSKQRIENGFIQKSKEEIEEFINNQPLFQM